MKFRVAVLALLTALGGGHADERRRLREGGLVASRNMTGVELEMGGFQDYMIGPDMDVANKVAVDGDFSTMGTDHEENQVFLIDKKERLKYMGDHMLDHIFRHGTINQGIPVGYYVGFSMLRGPMSLGQTLADATWSGKYFQMTSGKNCFGDCGQWGQVHNLQGKQLKWVYPGTVHMYKLVDIDKRCAKHQVDDKKSILVNYGNGAGDELRLINSEKRIYLGRGCAKGKFLGYFALEFYKY